MPSIEIFRAGSHRTAQGKPVTVTAADLAAVAAAYDFSAHEAPVVIGHPTQDAPAYGWVKALRAEGEVLVADLGQVNDDFAEMVRSGAFKKVSASFYPAGSPANPKPEGMYLRHVGFLGAQPPAIKGLAPINFADDGADVLDFGEVRASDVSWLARMTGELMRGWREYVIERDGVDKADQIIPSWRVDDAAALAGRIEAQADPAGAVAFSEPATHRKEAPVADTNAPSAAELKAREDRLAAERLEFSEQQRGFRRQQHGVFLDGLVAEGRPLPAPKDQLLDFMEGLSAGESLDFGEAGGGKVAPLDFFRTQVLAKLPRQVDFRERAPGDGGALDFAEDPAALAGRIQEVQAAAKANGITLTASEALARVKKEAGK